MELDQEQINEKSTEAKISRKEALKKVGITALAANSLMLLQTNALACGSTGGCSGGGSSGGRKGMGQCGNGSGTAHVPGVGSKKPESEGQHPWDDSNHTGENA